ncbi:MAG: glucose-1-phosphate thymidylyltransferase [Methanobacterium sp.]|jgi:glucose-1-phosphate thymidylyltransferase|nr:glucose-1-phosphate thymidylyltransferase [Methanobacterium sp.]
MKGLILSGGHGTRLRPLTHTGPKQLIPIANKPVLYYAIEDLKEAGVTEIGLILGTNMPEKVQEAVGDGSRFGVNITYIMQGEPKGLAHAVAVAQEFVGDESFIMYLGDNILKSGIMEFVEGFEDSDYQARILLQPVENPRQFGVAELDNNGNVINLVEKPEHPKSDLALVGIYLFKSSIFEAITQIKPSWRGELEITDAIQQLLNSNLKVDSHIVRGWWKDTGKPEDVLDANHLILDMLESQINGEVEDGAKISGRVFIGKGSRIKKNTVIRGPVSIGENCEIDAYIGPYTSIGDNSVIKGGEIESSIVVGDAVIKCNERIIDSLIGNHSHIISMENSLPKGYRFIIGENSLVNI